MASPMKPREPRQKVFLKARMQSDCGWEDVTIANVSSRGMLGLCSAPPPRGNYLEIRCRSQIIVGRVVWQGANCFGLHAQDRIEIAALRGQLRLTDRREQRRTATPSPVRSGNGRDFEHDAENSRRLGAAFEALVLAMTGFAAAAFAADTASTILQEPMESVTRALEKEKS